MRTLDQFSDFFHAQLVKDLGALEERRVGVYSKRMWFSGFTLGFVAVHWALTFIIGDLVPAWTLLLTVIGLPLLNLYLYQRVFVDPDIKADFKHTVIAKIVKFVDKDLSYDPEGYIPYDDFRGSRLFLQVPDHYHGDDLITGKIDGNPVQFSEIHASYESQAKGSGAKKPVWKRVFDGIFFVAELPRPLAGKTFILSDRMRKQLGYSGKIIQKNNYLRGKYIPVDDPDFSDNYVVYAEDELQTESLLTDSFRKLILGLRQNSGADVSISIIRNRVYVALRNDKEFFEPNMHQSLLDWALVSEFFADLVYILNIVDSLDLDKELPSDEMAA